MNFRESVAFASISLAALVGGAPEQAAAAQVPCNTTVTTEDCAQSPANEDPTAELIHYIPIALIIGAGITGVAVGAGIALEELATRRKR